jgi:hypothetical protein
MRNGLAIREIGHTYGTDAEGEGGDVARIVRDLQRLGVGSSVTICTIPAPLAVAWSEDAGITIRITNNSRRHYLGHSLIAEHEELVVEALLDPDQIRRDQKKPATKVLFYRERKGVLIAVVVKKRAGRGTYNPVVTAFNVPRDLKGRMHAEELLWQRER